MNHLERLATNQPTNQPTNGIRWPYAVFVGSVEGGTQSAEATVTQKRSFTSAFFVSVICVERQFLSLASG